MSPNATALESIKCTLGGTTLTDPYNLRAWPTDSKAGRYFVCYNTAVTLQSTPNARSAEGKASPPSAPAVAGTYRRTGARKPHFFWYPGIPGIPVCVQVVCPGSMSRLGVQVGCLGLCPGWWFWPNAVSVFDCMKTTHISAAVYVQFSGHLNCT